MEKYKDYKSIGGGLIRYKNKEGVISYRSEFSGELILQGKRRKKDDQRTGCWLNSVIADKNNIPFLEREIKFYL